jgi:hypothetical protein
MHLGALRLGTNREDYNRKYVIALLATMVMHPSGWTKAATLMVSNAPAHTSILERTDCHLPGGAPLCRSRGSEATQAAILGTPDPIAGFRI